MPDHFLDLRGLKCPLPVFKARKALRALPAGDRLTIECTDPMTAIDIPHFVAQDGHRLEAQERRDDIYVYKIEKSR